MYIFLKILSWAKFWRPEKLFKMYLEDIAIICNKNSIDDSQTFEAKQILNAISTILFVFFVKMLQFVLLLFYQNNTFVRFITYDFMIFFNCPPSMLTFNISYSAQLIYFVYKCYFFALNKKKVYPILLIYKIFFQNYDEYFLNSYKMKKAKKIKWSILLKKYAQIYQFLFQFCSLFFGNFNLNKLMLYIFSFI